MTPPGGEARPGESATPHRTSPATPAERHQALRARFEQVLERIQNPARLIGGETGAGPGFGGDAEELRVALAFPDTYEIGISNQALQILYHLAGLEPGVGVERVYLPWVDAIQELREAQIPLLTLETWAPVRDAHLLGISLQHELSYTNVLELLDLAGITLRAWERREDEPLVIAGGPATANFLPVAPFFDAVVVGEAEEAFPELLRELRAARSVGLDRAGRKERLAALPGVFVPGVSRTVSRRVLPRLEGAPYPTGCLVPLTAGVHDRAWVEVMRGCCRGCRFCQAGMWYRPVRERTGDDVLAKTEALVAATGYQEVSLASLSTTDYTGLEPTLTALATRHPELHIGLPSLRVDTAAVRLAHLTSPTSPSLTLAPEAGSQRMRDVVNKNVTEAEILAAAREVFTLGHTTLKLYFMIGLPTETDEDVLAIVDLCAAIREVGRRTLGPKASRLQLHVSVTNSIPKPFTPFQWGAMTDRETLGRRQELLRHGMRRLRARLALHDIDGSYLEAALARGGEAMADVIEGAWRRGARFDNWTEHERPAAWAEAFGAAGLSPETLATSPLAPDAPLPWDRIDGVVTKSFLLDEWHRAERQETTPDCRWGDCPGCGACHGELGHDLVGAAAALPVIGGRRGAGVDSVPASGDSPGATSASVASPSRPAGRAMPVPLRLRYVLRFSVRGRARFLAHLDTLELLRRAVRRAGGRLALSSGLRPKPLLGVALPRAVGVEGAAELAEFTLSEGPPADFARRFAAALPEGFAVLGLEPVVPGPSLAAEVTGADYRVVAAAAAEAGGPPTEDDRLIADVSAAARRYTSEQELLVDRARAGKQRAIDVRRYVDAVEVRPSEQGLDVLFEAAVTPQGTVRPEEVVEALGRLAGRPLVVRRAERLEIHLGKPSIREVIHP